MSNIAIAIGQSLAYSSPSPGADVSKLAARVVGACAGVIAAWGAIAGDYDSVNVTYFRTVSAEIESPLPR